jgi:hypothetical protein
MTRQRWFRGLAGRVALGLLDCDKAAQLRLRHSPPEFRPTGPNSSQPTLPQPPPDCFLRHSELICNLGHCQQALSDHRPPPFPECAGPTSRKKSYVSVSMSILQQDQHIGQALSRKTNSDYAYMALMYTLYFGVSTKRWRPEDTSYLRSRDGMPEPDRCLMSS